MIPQQPISVATDSPGAPSDQMLSEVAACLAERRIYGLVWCDEDLMVQHRYGELAAFVELGAPLAECLLPLAGSVESIKALRRKPDNSYTIANISIRRPDFVSPRLNISVYWLARQRTYLILLGRLSSRSDVETEYARSVRDGRIKNEVIAQKTKEIERANRELERVNGDLEEFAYVISHDLRAPLRALRYLSSDLEQSLAKIPASADAEAAKRQLDQLKQQTRRMSAMLNGLFDYASIGRRPDAICRVDTRQLIDDITGSLSPGHAIALHVEGAWPVLASLDQPLDLVLRNLIDNAIKHHDRSSGNIHINAEDAGAHWAFTISDDGPGIPEDYQQAVFRPFLKVDDDARPDNSGVGLALVKKTVECLGGSITLTSAPATERGATFRVLWPVNLDL